MTKKIEVELPVIPREVAEAIERLRDSSVFNPAFTDAEIITKTIDGDRDAISLFWTLRTVPLDTLILALVNGYETEKTAVELAEEKRRQAYEELLERYEYFQGNAALTQNGGHARTAHETIKWVLNTLGIEIEGVNA